MTPSFVIFCISVQREVMSFYFEGSEHLSPKDEFQLFRVPVTDFSIINNSIVASIDTDSFLENLRKSQVNPSAFIGLFRDFGKHLISHSFNPFQ